MAYCQAMPLPVLQFTPRSLNPALFGWAILSNPLWAEPRMRETRATAWAQLIRASNLEDLSDANYRQKVPYYLKSARKSVGGRREPKLSASSGGYGYQPHPRLPRRTAQDSGASQRILCGTS